MTDSREKSRHRIPIASPLVYVLVGQYSLSLSLSLSLSHTHTHTHTSGTHTHTLPSSFPCNTCVCVAARAERTSLALVTRCGCHGGCGLLVPMGP